MKRLGDEFIREGEGEEKHLPLIEAPERVKAGESFEVKIRVGKEPHPSTLEHHIRWIQVFLKPENRPMLHITTFEPGPAVVEPGFTFKMALDRPASIYVLCYCNIHGIWENSLEIEIS